MARTLGMAMVGALALGMMAAVAMGQAAPAAPPAAEPARRMTYRPTRADLALAYLRFERAMAANPPTGGRLDRIGRGFDAATGSFFRGGFSSTVRQLDALTESLLSEVPGGVSARGRRVAGSLRAAVEPVVFQRGSAGRPVVRLDRLYELPARGREDGGAGAGPVRIEVRVVPAGAGEDAAPVAAAVFEVAADGMGELPKGELGAAGAALPVGAYEVRLGVEGGQGPARTTARWFVVEGSLDAQRERNAARAGALEARLIDPALGAALAAFRSRNNLLSDRPSPADAAQFMADQSALSSALERELAALEAGENPYREHPGDLWRTVVIADAHVPVRVYSPFPRPVPGEAPPSPRPLVIALHGAGGDENMFMDAYGLGAIKSLADRHGFYVASPRNNPFASDPVYFDALVAALSADYAIDPARIYVVGHSMGGGVGAAWGRLCADRVAAVAAIASFPPARSLGEHERMAPMLVVMAERDGIIPMARVRPAAEGAAAAGLPVELRVVPGHGHTTVVGAVLPEVVGWLMERRLE